MLFEQWHILRVNDNVPGRAQAAFANEEPTKKLLIVCLGTTRNFPKHQKANRKNVLCRWPAARFGAQQVLDCEGPDGPDDLDVTCWMGLVSMVALLLRFK